MDAQRLCDELHIFERAHSFRVEHVLAGVPPPAIKRTDVESLYPRPTGGLAQEATPQTLWAIERKSQLEGVLSLVNEEIAGLKDTIAQAIGPAERLT